MEAAPCLHGGGEALQASGVLILDIMDHWETIKEIRSCPARHEPLPSNRRYKATIDTVYGKLASRFGSSLSMDKLNAKFRADCLAFATEAILDDNGNLPQRMKAARDCCTLEMEMHYENLSDMSAKVKAYRKTRRILTDRELILHASKSIPCACLYEKRQLALRQPKTVTCLGCDEEKLRVDVRPCSRCLFALYCSKECQVKDWKNGHKQMCPIICRQNEKTNESSQVEGGEGN